MSSMDVTAADEAGEKSKAKAAPVAPAAVTPAPAEDAAPAHANASGEVGRARHEVWLL